LRPLLAEQRADDRIKLFLEDRRASAERNRMAGVDAELRKERVVREQPVGDKLRLK
jgi:hypothetical protein